jgi:hypothetical protein
MRGAKLASLPASRVISRECALNLDTHNLNGMVNPFCLADPRRFKGLSNLKYRSSTGHGPNDAAAGRRKRHRRKLESFRCGIRPEEVTSWIVRKTTESLGDLGRTRNGLTCRFSLRAAVVQHKIDPRREHDRSLVRCAVFSTEAARIGGNGRESTSCARPEKSCSGDSS